MHKYTASPPACSAVVGIADGAESALITARRAACMGGLLWSAQDCTPRTVNILRPGRWVTEPVPGRIYVEEWSGEDISRVQDQQACQQQPLLATSPAACRSRPGMGCDAEAAERLHDSLFLLGWDLG